MVATVTGVAGGFGLQAVMVARAAARTASTNNDFLWFMEITSVVDLLVW
jgi:hypothetical protein